MKFSVAPRIFEMFPDLFLGVVIAKGLDNRGYADELKSLISALMKDIRANTSSETLSQNPKIASWRRAYSAFGAKPKKYKSSVESLFRMALKGIDLRPINKVVDVYNYISIKHIVPVGGDDIARVDGDISLRFAQADEIFRPLNSEEIERVKEGEVVYADHVEVLCRRWNWRECDKTKLTEETEEVMLVVEGLPPVNREEVNRILEELSRLIESYCGGATRSEVLHGGHREIMI